jgi:hypothetical protein
MANAIIYPQDNVNIALVMPTGELPIEDVAQKDVPAGVPYLIVDLADVPEDHTFFGAWEADFSNPDGHGLGADAYFAAQQETNQ